jgi:uncharacterized protein
VVKVGDIVKVKVLEVDVNRKRIQLSMRLNDAPQQIPQQRGITNKTREIKQPSAPKFDTAIGNALLSALGRK